jgi:small ligand-binding sensory domain FIST
MILGTPTSPYVDQMVKHWNKAYAGVSTVGGLATTAQTAEENAVFWNDRIIKEGCIVLAFRGRIKVRSLVSQGCRPIGEPLTITRVDKNVVFTLGAKSAYDVLYGAFEKLSKNEKDHAYGNLFVGLATSEYVDSHKRGQFLIRNIMGADPDTGAVAIASYPRLGQTFQYQLRDKETAHEDLENLLVKESTRKQQPFAAMLFACNGRGSALFETENHDAAMLEEKLGEMPTTGFFCAGEIGPIGKENYIHGYTASMAFFMDGKE